MTAARDAAGRIVIFSDEPGWHGRMLRQAFANLGHAAVYVPLSACEFDLSGERPRLVIPGFAHDLPAAVFVRGVAGGSLEQVVLRLNVLHCLEMLGVPVCNSGRAIERTVDKGMTSFLLCQRQIPTPRTWVCEDVTQARVLAAAEFAAGRMLVQKPLFGSQGEGVVRLRSLAELEWSRPASGVYYLQEYLDRSGPPYRDWRVLVVAGRAVAAMERISPHWVTNRAQGARCIAAALDPSMRSLAEAAAAAVAIDYAGIDLMQDVSGRWLVGEVNGIPAWQGLQATCELDIAALLARTCLARIEQAQTLHVQT